MKLTSISRSLVWLTLGLFSAQAATTESFSFPGLNLDVPDGSPVGIGNVQNVASSIGLITGLTVGLNIQGTQDANPLAFNSDLYVYLQHGAGISILLNRVGVSVATPFGYDGNGLNITLDDAAANGDVHKYRSVTLLDAPLTGTWAPDGRATSPNTVLDTDPRTPSSLLGTFNGSNASGDWTLFVADLSTGEQHTLQNWSLSITGVAIPETQSVALLSIGGLLAVAGCARKHWRR